jgi:hypothetical protein
MLFYIRKDKGKNCGYCITENYFIGGQSAMTEASIKEFFSRYQRFFTEGLAGNLDTETLSELYTSEFIAVSPAGVMTGKNDDTFKQNMINGYAHYRNIGTKGMMVQNIRLSPIDNQHSVAHVAWTAVYAKDSQQDIIIDFEVHYLIQELDGQIKIFGWVSGDEQALLRERGVV